MPKRSRSPVLRIALPSVLIVLLLIAVTLVPAALEVTPSRYGSSQASRLSSPTGVESAPGDAGVARRGDGGERHVAGRRAAVIVSPVGGETPRPRASLPADALAGLTQRIEDPTGSMVGFYNRLVRAGRREPGAQARVLFFSESINGCDRVGSTLRRGLQRIFGDAGKGFVPIAPGWGSQEHRDVHWEHRLWRTIRINRGELRSGRYGLGGVIAMNRGPRSRTIVGTVDDGASGRAASRFQLLYQAFPEGGTVRLRIDDGAPETVSTESSVVEDRLWEGRAPDGQHQLAVEVEEGSLRLYGVVMERDHPGVVVDSVMLIGATVGITRNYDAEHLVGQVRVRSPDLIVYWIGANDVRARAFTHDRYVEQLERFIDVTRRGNPSASCLVMSEHDQGEEVNGRLRSRSRVRAVIEAQRAAATSRGCAFFDLHAAVGGVGTVRRWYMRHPRRITRDFLHLTDHGALEVGEHLLRALLAGYEVAAPQ